MNDDAYYQTWGLTLLIFLAVLFAWIYLAERYQQWKAKRPATPRPHAHLTDQELADQYAEVSQVFTDPGEFYARAAYLQHPTSENLLTWQDAATVEARKKDLWHELRDEGKRRGWPL